MPQKDPQRRALIDDVNFNMAIEYHNHHVCRFFLESTMLKGQGTCRNDAFGN